MTATTDTIADAFTDDEEALIAADELAARIASGALDAGDTPSAIRDVFAAVGFDQAAAAAEVERHRKIIEARAQITEAAAARVEIEKINARSEELLNELEETRKRYDAEQRELREVRWAHEPIARRDLEARRAIQHQFLPGHVKGKLTALHERRVDFVEQRKRLEKAMLPEVRVDVDHLARAYRQGERERVQRLNEKRAAERKDLAARIEPINAELEQIEAQEQQLRGMYLP